MAGTVEPFKMTAFKFEKLDNGTLLQFVKNYDMLSVWSSLLYVVVIFGAQWIMQRKEKYDLSSALTLWSGMLALFSVIGTVRMWPEIIHVLRYEGLYHSSCVASYMEHPATQFWAGLFTLSKIIELGDTMFIVLRKKPLIFLHWYHHISALLYTWYSFPNKISYGRWFICLNFAAHAIMYSYYTLRAMKIRVPNKIRMSITLFQLIQMVIGCLINFYVYSVKKQGHYCEVSVRNIGYSFAMYFSYFVLFAKFFYDSYINVPSRAAVSLTEEKKQLRKAQ